MSLASELINVSPEVIETLEPQPEKNRVSFSFDRLLVRKALFEQIERTPSQEGEKKPSTLEATLDLALSVQLNATRRDGQVTLATVIHPDLKWQPYRLEVTVSGVFGTSDASPELFDEFCRRAVPTILFPYVRQIVHMLTVDAAYGVVRINPINIQQLMANNWQRVESDPSASAP